jgi:hypothetical protein
MTFETDDPDVKEMLALPELAVLENVLRIDPSAASWMEGGVPLVRTNGGLALRHLRDWLLEQPGDGDLLEFLLGYKPRAEFLDALPGASIGIVSAWYGLLDRLFDLAEEVDPEGHPSDLAKFVNRLQDVTTATARLVMPLRRRWAVLTS